MIEKMEKIRRMPIEELAAHLHGLSINSLVAVYDRRQALENDRSEAIVREMATRHQLKHSEKLIEIAKSMEMGAKK